MRRRIGVGDIVGGWFRGGGEGEGEDEVGKDWRWIDMMLSSAGSFGELSF